MPLTSRTTRWAPLLLLTAAICNADDLEFRKIVINADSLYSAAVAFDVDHDGDIDIVGGGLWYEAPTWKPHKVRDVEIIRGMPDGFAAQPYDVNHDGWMDFFEVNWRSKSIKWIEHPGKSLGEWTAHLVAEPGGMESGRLYDVDGDGNLDLVPNGVQWAAWWNLVPKDGGTELIRREWPQEAAGHGFAFGDVNGDGRNDMVSSKGWLEAPEDRIHGEWKWHGEFDLGRRVSVPFLVQDVDSDGDNDLIYSDAHGYGLYWQEQIRDGGQRTWRRREIDTSWSQGHFLLWEDLDQNGRSEVIGGKRYMAHGGADPGAEDTLSIYRYEYDPETRKWERWTIERGNGVGFGLDAKAVDIDADGDLDLVAPGRSGLYLLENLLK